MVLNLLDVFTLEGTLKDLKEASYLPAVIPGQNGSRKSFVVSVFSSPLCSI